MTNICCKLISLCLNRHIRLTLYSCQNKIFLNNIYVLFCLFLLNCFYQFPLQLLYVCFIVSFFSLLSSNYIKVTNTTPIFINCIVVLLLLHLHLQSDLSFGFYQQLYMHTNYYFLSHETPLYLDELLHFALLHLVLLPSVVRFFLVKSLFFIFGNFF